MADVAIRPYRTADAAATAQLFYDAVRGGTDAHYDPDQRRAWAPEVPDTDAWRDRLADQTVFVAERAGRLAGFMTLTADGCIDLAFVAPDCTGQGIAGALYDRIVDAAREKGLTHLTADASHLLRPFLERRGWRVVREQTVEREGVALTNFVMEMLPE
jgi:putative acetyltransferase